MFWVLIIGGFIAAICMLCLCPVLLIGGIISVLCFVFDHPVAGVIVGISTIIAQVTVGREFGIYGGAGGTSSGYSDYEDHDNVDNGFGFPELYIAYKFGKHNGKKDKD